MQVIFRVRRYSKQIPPAPPLSWVSSSKQSLLHHFWPHSGHGPILVLLLLGLLEHFWSHSGPGPVLVLLLMSPSWANDSFWPQSAQGPVLVLLLMGHCEQVAVSSPTLARDQFWCSCCWTPHGQMTVSGPTVACSGAPANRPLIRI